MTPKITTTIGIGIVTIIGYALYIGGINIDNGLPNPITVNGQTITFPYTDSKVDENMIIYTNELVYNQSVTTAEIYLAVVNNSGKPQNASLTAYFRDNTKNIKEVLVLNEVTKEIVSPVYTKECKMVVASSTKENIEECTDIQTSTTTEQVKELVWMPMALEVKATPTKPPVDKIANMADKDKFSDFISVKKTVEKTIAKNEVLYYKVTVQYPPKSADELFFEIVGNDGGKGVVK
jgi:hypothetical protein